MAELGVMSCSIKICGDQNVMLLFAANEWSLSSEIIGSSLHYHWPIGSSSHPARRKLVT